MRTGRVWMLLLWLGVCGASAQEVTSVFIAPTQSLNANVPASIWLYSLNNSPGEQRQVLPIQLKGDLISPAGTNEVLLTLNTNQSRSEVVIAPGTFCKTEYRLNVPAGVEGEGRLVVDRFNPILLTIAAENQGTNLLAMPSGEQPLTKTNGQVGDRLVHFLGDHLSTYEPIYFLLGSYPAAKFQFSLKYRVFSLTNEDDPLSYLYFAYTQTSFWDLISSDPSFYDTSYKPSGFLYYPGILLHKDDTTLDLQAGIEHESNGRGGLEERSLNTIYLQPTLKYQPTDDLTFRLQPRFWYYISMGNNNPDLADYRGYGDLLGSVQWKSVEFATKLRMGKDWNHEGWQFDLWFELPEFFHFNPALQVEYFTGYGQTLRQYNQISHGIRGGLCLWY